MTARLPVDELAELFGVKIEVEDVETVGGLLAQRLGRVPIAGSTAKVAGLRLTAESLAGRRNRISTVTVTRRRRGGSGGRAGEEAEPSEPASAEESRASASAWAGAGSGTTRAEDTDTDQWAWAADDLPGTPAAELAEKATELEDRSG